MALNQSALDEIAAMLKNGDSFDLVRRAMEFVVDASMSCQVASAISGGLLKRR